MLMLFFLQDFFQVLDFPRGEGASPLAPLQTPRYQVWFNTSSVLYITALKQKSFFKESEKLEIFKTNFDYREDCLPKLRPCDL